MKTSSKDEEMLPNGYTKKTPHLSMHPHPLPKANKMDDVCWFGVGKHWLLEDRGGGRDGDQHKQQLPPSTPKTLPKKIIVDEVFGLYSQYPP